MLYFAYGMNTNRDEMASRCPKAICLGLAKLPDWRFRFAGCADVVKEPGSVVDGVLWDITKDCLVALDRLEGYPNFYNSCPVMVEHRGQLVEAEVYYMNPGVKDDLPSDHYKECVMDGYKHHSVPVNQILESINQLMYKKKAHRGNLMYN